MASRHATIAAACVVSAVGASAAGPMPVVDDSARLTAYGEYCQLCHQIPATFGDSRCYEEWRVTVARMSGHRQNLTRSAIPTSAQILIARHLSESLGSGK